MVLCNDDMENPQFPSYIYVTRLYNEVVYLFRSDFCPLNWLGILIICKTISHVELF